MYGLFGLSSLNIDIICFLHFSITVWLLVSNKKTAIKKKTVLSSPSEGLPMLENRFYLIPARNYFPGRVVRIRIKANLV